MKVRFQSSDLQDILLEKHYPNLFRSTDTGGITERTYSASLLGGKGHYQEMFMENIHIGYGDLWMQDLTELAFEAEGESVEMHFALCGHTKAEERRGRRGFEFHPNQHNLIFASHFHGKTLYAARARIQVFEVNLLPTYFQRFLPEEDQLFRSFRLSLTHKQTTSLRPYNYPVTSTMHSLIQDIMQCRRKGHFKRMFLEAKVTELLMLQLEQLAEEHAPSLYRMNRQEVERLQAVKTYLQQHLDSPFTLFQLATEFGTNEFALKKGFKSLFGTTVFTFWQNEKMKQARHWLLEEQLTVSDIADRIGYQHPQHFSTAFKRHFGYPPSQLRKGKNGLYARP
ncbi:MAG: AraC family transcriptional regulator [Bacteroidota bacterium]